MAWMTEIDELVARGFEFRGTCPECGDPVGRAYYEDNWVTKCCGKALTNPPTQDDADRAEFDTWAADLDVWYEEHKEKQIQEGNAYCFGGQGHELFQLPEDCPDRFVKSISEMKAAYNKYGIDPDTHRFKNGQGPASPNQRRRGGKWTLDGHDRDLGA